MLRSHARARCGQVGPGWKPSAEQLESSHILAQQNPALRGPAASGGLARAATPVPPDETAAVGSDDGRTMLGWVPSNNPFEQDWTPAPLKPSASGIKGEVEVDLTGPRLARKEPLAVRLGWLADVRSCLSQLRYMYVLPHSQGPGWDGRVHPRQLPTLLEQERARCQPILRGNQRGEVLVHGSTRLLGLIAAAQALPVANSPRAGGRRQRGAGALAAGRRAVARHVWRREPLG